MSTTDSNQPTPLAEGNDGGCSSPATGSATFDIFVALIREGDGYRRTDIYGDTAEAVDQSLAMIAKHSAENPLFQWDVSGAIIAPAKLTITLPNTDISGREAAQPEQEDDGK